MVEVGGNQYDLWMTFTAKHRTEKAPVTKGGTLQAGNFWVAGGKDDLAKALIAGPAKDLYPIASASSTTTRTRRSLPRPAT